MKTKISALEKKREMDRREFLKVSAQSGVVLGSVPFLGACHDDDESSDPTKERRTYYLDLSHTDEGDTHHLIVGSNIHELIKIDEHIVRNSKNTLLQSMPVGMITHHITADFPNDSIQACYVRTTKADDPEGVWSMPLSFFHLPSSSVRKAALRGKGSLESSVKLSYYNIDSSIFNDGIELQDAYLHEDAIKAFTDHAVDLAFHHPEMLSMESDSAAHIQKNIIGMQPTTYELSIKLNQQGSASESGGWATLEPYINKDTGEPYMNSQGKKQYFPRYSDTTNTYLGNAINPSLESVKNDVTLGANITDLDPSVENPEMNGKIWKIHDGITTVEADGLRVGDSDYYIDMSNKSYRHGYQARMKNYDHRTGEVTIKVENWFVRYLGIYVQFLDSDGEKIKVKDLPSATKDSFEEGNSSFDSDYNKNAAIIASEWELLGIPLHHKTKEISFIWPEMASSAIIIAGGIGANSKETYAGTVEPAAICTAIINLAIPTVFLIAGAATGLIAFASDLESFENIELFTFIADVIIESLADTIALLSGDDPEIFAEVGKTIGEFLLSKGATWWFTKKMEANLGEGEVLDAVPVVGKILAVIAAAGLVAELAETISEVLNSPTNYSSTLTVTHDITVTINHDPNDTAGFPAVADTYSLTAMFDKATPHYSGKIDMPGTTVTDPITYTFKNVPYGGNVNISVTFNADKDNWLAGAGSTGIFTNDVDSANITITEVLVPLNSDTVYGHKQKIVLDKLGNHIWKASTTAPLEKADSLQCESVDGDLCQLNGITVSEHYGTLGYGWKAYSSDVTSCESSGVGQLHQFATASFTQNPEDSYLAPSCGFSAPPRIIYDLMSSKNNNYYLDTTDGKNLIRQVRLDLDGKPSIDAPDSNVCWGEFNLPSDALLLHPSRKLISINSALNKIEILTLQDEATTDDKAPLAVAYSGKGTRHGLVRGPVAAAISPQGVILILEAKNRRVQAFDTGLNPTKHFFHKTGYHFLLKAETETIYYTDMAMEYTGFIYILSYTASYVYRLDIYDKDGNFVSRTTGVNAAKMTVDLWRNVFSLNYEVLKMPDGTQPTVTEPSVSQWIPSVP